MRYTINSIFLPQIEYLSTDLVLKENLINKIDRKIRSNFRHKCVLSKVFPMAGLHSNLGYELFALKDWLVIRIGSEFLARLNSKYINGIITKIQLQAIQNKL